MVELKLPLRALTTVFAISVAGIVVCLGGSIWTAVAQHSVAPSEPTLGAPSLGQ